MPYGSTSVSPGDVVGPALAVDNALVRFDGTTGKLVQNSVLIVADTTGALSGFTTGVGITFHGSGTLTGASGALTLTASGTDKNITLTPSGTGDVVVTAASVRMDNLEYLYGKTAGGNARGLIGSTAGDIVEIGHASSWASIDLLPGAAVKMRVMASGNTLVGGLTTEGTGVLQFPAATTNAGGINFGTEIFFFRTGTNTAQISASAGLTHTGPILTSAPAGGAGSWELGTLITSGTSVFSTTSYVEIEIGGTIVKLGVVTNT